jgi:hypothetical protein
MPGRLLSGNAYTKRPKFLIKPFKSRENGKILQDDVCEKVIKLDGLYQGGERNPSPHVPIIDGGKPYPGIVLILLGLKTREYFKVDEADSIVMEIQFPGSHHFGILPWSLLSDFRAGLENLESVVALGGLCKLNNCVQVCHQ